MHIIAEVHRPESVRCIRLPDALVPGKVLMAIIV